MIRVSNACSFKGADLRKGHPISAICDAFRSVRLYDVEDRHSVFFVAKDALLKAMVD